MTKVQFEILDYIFDDGDLVIDFTINNEEGYRILSVSEDDFVEYIENSGELEMFSDEWDYATESHYTKDWVISYDEYVSEYLNNDILVEYMIYYFKNKDYPVLIKED